MTEIRDKHVNRYTSAQVCAAVGISPDTLKNWVSRKPQVVLLTNEERAEVERSGRLFFSFNSIMQIALTEKLSRMGLQPRRATVIAAGFTDIGHGPVGGQPSRDPGELFLEGLTVLTWHEGVELGHTVNVYFSTTKAHDLFWFMGVHEDACGVIVNHLYHRIEAALAGAGA